MVPILVLSGMVHLTPNKPVGLFYWVSVRAAWVRSPWANRAFEVAHLPGSALVNNRLFSIYCIIIVHNTLAPRDNATAMKKRA